MELLATGASIAGLLSLARQCVSGAQNLWKLYRDVASVSRTADDFLKDVNRLLRTLYDVQNLLQRIEGQSALKLDGVQLTTLRLQLEDCESDFSTWLSTAQRSRPPSG